MLRYVGTVGFRSLIIAAAVMIAMLATAFSPGASGSLAAGTNTISLKADLLISSTNVSSEWSQANGYTHVVQVTVRNNGFTDTAPFQVLLTRGRYQDMVTGSLRAQASQVFVFRVPVGNSCDASGEIFVDILSRVAESNELNNTGRWRKIC